MNRKTRLAILALTVIAGWAKAQPYPKNYFAAPVDTPLVIIGTFGEIRKNHFHSGIDFATDQQEGKIVYAAADGYVSRIKISNNGFGKAMYIAHTNGFVTVYGHLKKFNKQIQQYVLNAQYKQKSYEVELFPGPKEISVKKKEVIAFSGSSGDAEGPHLHFEIRDGKTEEPINPLLFGIKIKDTLPPVISNIRIFPLAGRGVLINTDAALTYRVGKSSKTYSINEKNPIPIYGTIGFGIEATDHQQNSEGALGIYSAELKMDNAIVYSYRMDRLNFNDLRYVNAHIDYRSKLRDNLVIQRFFRLPGNHLKIYSDSSRNGYLNFLTNGSHDLEYTVSDFNGNHSTLNVHVVSKTDLAGSPAQKISQNDQWISDQKGIELHQPDAFVTVPVGAVYERCSFEFSESDNGNKISRLIHVGDRFVPVHSFITIGIKPLDLPSSLKSKAVIVSIDEHGKKNYEGGEWDGQFLKANVKYFGDFTMAVDTTAPVITKLHRDSDVKQTENLQFKISDQLSGIKSYNAIVDGNWLLMEYQKTENTITGDLSELPKNKQHRIVLTVTDKKENKSTFEGTFFY